MDNDDELKGRVLSRREMLGLMSAAGVAFIVGCDDDDGPGSSLAQETAAGGSPTFGATAAASATASDAAVPACVVQPDLVEGPYFVDAQLERSDIRADSRSNEARPGVPLALTFVVSAIGNNGSCEPLESAHVDVWHCDALGVYSGVQDPSFDTLAEDWLRGYQRTNANGRADFVTIYPGWYPGRATHIHFKIRTNPDSGAGTEFTSQLFFDDALSDDVHAEGVYAEKGVDGRTRNGQDGIFGGSGGQLTLDVRPEGDGYATTFEVGVMARQLTADRVADSLAS